MLSRVRRRGYRDSDVTLRTDRRGCCSRLPMREHGPEVATTSGQFERLCAKNRELRSLDDLLRRKSASTYSGTMVIVLMKPRVSLDNGEDVLYFGV